MAFKTEPNRSHIETWAGKAEAYTVQSQAKAAQLRTANNNNNNNDIISLYTIRHKNKQLFLLSLV